MWAAPKVRTALRRPYQHRVDQPCGPGARVATRCANALLAQAQELVLLSPKSVPNYGGQGGPSATVIPVGIDRLPLTPRPDELQWRPGALRVLYVGRFAPEKSLPLLVQALDIAVRQGVDAHLVMVGEGPLAGDLAQQAARAGVADRLTILGPYPRSSLRGIYASADVFAFPSIVETQAFVLNEAAHEGLPLLVSDPDVNSVVCDGQSALVVAHKAMAYAQGLRQLLDPLLRSRLGAVAQQRAGCYLESTQTAQLAAVLHAAVHGRTTMPVEHAEQIEQIEQTELVEVSVPAR
jgi:glycosyltransferase involved in cell wall biosynthesis